MSRKFLGKTKSTQLEKLREKYLNNSTRKLNELREILEFLKKNIFVVDQIQHLYDREQARNERLTKLLEKEIQK